MRNSRRGIRAKLLIDWITSTRLPPGSAKKATRRPIAATSCGWLTIVTPRRFNSSIVSSTLSTRKAGATQGFKSSVGRGAAKQSVGKALPLRIGISAADFKRGAVQNQLGGSLHAANADPTRSSPKTGSPQRRSHCLTTDS